MHKVHTLLFKQQSRSLVLLFFLWLHGGVVRAQGYAHSYLVKTFQQTSTKIRISYRTFSGRVVIASPRDSLVLLTRYLAVAQVVQNNFLLVTYGVRGGTGLTLSYTLLLYVDKGRLHQAFHVNSYTLSCCDGLASGKEQQQQRYFKLTGHNIKTYQVAVYEQSNNSHSTHSKHSSASRKKIAQWPFDTTIGIFRQTALRLPNLINIDDEQTGKTRKIAIAGTLPANFLGREKYVYRHGQWYELSQNTLQQLAYRSR